MLVVVGLPTATYGFVALNVPAANTAPARTSNACDGGVTVTDGGLPTELCIEGETVPTCVGGDDQTCQAWRAGTECSYVGKDPVTGADRNACLPQTQPFALEALNVSPDVVANLTDQSQLLVPSFHGTGELNIITSRHRNVAFTLDEDFHVAPKPTVGDSADVARRIRFMPGVVGGSLSVKFSWLPRYLNPAGQKGSEGLQCRAAIRGEYEAADLAIDQGSGLATVSGSSFFLGASEVAVGVWLRYAYVGMLWDHFFVSGSAPQPLAADLQDSNAIKAELVVRVQGPLTKDGNEKPAADNYFVFTVGRDRSWAPPMVQFSYAVSFSPL